MKTKLFLLTLALTLISFTTTAKYDFKDEKDNDYFAGFSVGGGLGFGDDSYNIISDFNNANGISASLYFGKDFSKVFGARINARYNKLYSRVNLEILSMRDEFPDLYGDLFPRDGFYGYNCYGLQADAMFNPVNYIPRKVDIFNLYLLCGIGANMVNGYSSYVKDWSRESDALPGGWYEVDTKTHIMPAVMIGGILDFKLCKQLHLNFQLDCTFTGDNLEGVVSQEFYDAYISYSIGLTAHF